MRIVEDQSSGYPERIFEYADGVAEREIRLGAESVSRGGILASWRIGSKWEGTVDLTSVSSSDASQWNDWWRRQSVLLVTFQESGEARSVRARIINREIPLSYRTPGSDRWDGIVQFAAANGDGIVKGTFFELSHITLGQLSRDYNPLSSE